MRQGGSSGSLGRCPNSRHSRASFKATEEVADRAFIFRQPTWLHKLFLLLLTWPLSLSSNGVDKSRVETIIHAETPRQRLLQRHKHSILRLTHRATARGFDTFCRTRASFDYQGLPPPNDMSDQRVEPTTIANGNPCRHFGHYFKSDMA